MGTPEAKKAGRPLTDATPIMLRLTPSAVASLDAWIAKQPAPRPTRPEAVRRILEQVVAPAGEASIPLEELNASNDE